MRSTIVAVPGCHGPTVSAAGHGYGRRSRSLQDVGPFPMPGGSRQPHVVALFFRVIELDSGRWACRHGNTEYDQHARAEDALQHIETLALEQRPAEIYLHLRDGTVRRVKDV